MQLKKQIQSEIRAQNVVLKNLNDRLSSDKTCWYAAEIQSIRYEIRKTEFEIIQKREHLCGLNERLYLLNLKNYAD